MPFSLSLLFFRLVADHWQSTQAPLAALERITAATNRTPNGPGTLPFAARASRIVAGHPEGFHEGFANLYTDAAQVIAARRSGQAADPLAQHFPNSFDGLQGVRFVAAVIRSSAANGAWVDCQ